MSTSLANSRIALSKEIADYWASTTTSAGAAGGTTIVDTGLKAKANDWVTDEMYTLITESGHTAEDEERKVSSLDNSTGTITNLAHSAQIGSSVDYELHRLFSASEKRLALIHGLIDSYPYLHKKIRDESMVSGNWFKDGSFERWTDSTTPVDWTVTTLTCTRTSTTGYVRHGTYSAKLDTAAGTLSVTYTGDADLQWLRGKSVTFSIQAYCDTASALRISIYDGTTQTYSSYHDGDSAWTQENPRNDSLYCTQYIDPNATEVTFYIHLESAAATAYVDDARAISGFRNKLYIGHLGLFQDRPNEVLIERQYYYQGEPWVQVRDWDVDDSGYLLIPDRYQIDRRLRIIGKGVLDYLDTDGAVGTDWADTVNINDPQHQILVAAAALYLYKQMSLPNYETGTRKDFQEAISYWQQEFAMRAAKFGMDSRTKATVHWGVG